MQNKLENGMEFKNMIKLCEYIGWTYEYKYSPRINNKLRKYVDFHRVNRNKIVIDNVKTNDLLEQFEHKNFDYIYNIGEIIDVNNGKIQILEQTLKKTKDSNRRAYKCKCLNENCGYEYIDYEYTLVKKVGCGCCSGKVVVRGVNDLNTTSPELSKLLLNKENGYKYTEGSKHKLDWVCPLCGEIRKNKSIINIAKRGVPCVCSNSKSYPNRFMYWLLRNINMNFKDEKSFNWSILENGSRKIYDFYIEDKSCIIEMHGSQHYVENWSFTHISLESQQENDRLKKNLASKNNIKYYIEIDSRQSDFDYIRKNVLNSDLSKIINMTNADWKWIQEKTESNIILDIANIWNSGEYNVNKIGKIVGLTKSPVDHYLNKCDKLGYINYDKKKSKTAGTLVSQGKLYQSTSEPLMCNENNLYFGSITICKNTMETLTGLKFFYGNIRGTMKGRYSHHHHFTFKQISRTEFNNLKTEFPDKCYGDFFDAEKPSQAPPIT